MRIKATTETFTPMAKMEIGQWQIEGGNILSICLPSPVSVNNINRTKAIMGRNGKPVPIYHSTKQATAFKKRASEILKGIPDSAMKCIDRDNWLCIKMFIFPDVITLDVDNTGKLAIDCMKKDGRLMRDDCQVSSFSSRKYIRTHGVPRCVVYVLNDPLMEKGSLREAIPSLFNESRNT